MNYFHQSADKRKKCIIICHDCMLQQEVTVWWFLSVFHLVRFSDLTQREARKHSKSKYHIQSGLYCLAMREWFGFMMVNIKMIDGWMLPSSVLYLLSEDFISRNGPPEERGGCEIGRKELKWQKAGRRSLQRITKRRRKAGPLFHPLQLKSRREWDRATIWPQLRAMRCRSTKINGNNSTLDAHHYPDGVLGDGVGHLTASRDGTDSDQTPPPNSMILAVYFRSSDRAENGPLRPSATEPSVDFKLGTRDSKGAPNQTCACWPGGLHQR